MLFWGKITRKSDFQKKRSADNNATDSSAEKELQGYVEKQLGIDLSGDVLEENGSVGKDSGEEYAYIKLTISPDKKKSVVEMLDGKYSRFDNIESFKLPGYQGHEFKKELDNSEIEEMYFVMTSGNKAKTRSITVYIVNDASGNSYLYFMG